MCLAPGDKKDQYVFSHVISALVGLGYQVQLFFACSVNAGGCSGRKTIILSIDAPGLIPLPLLQATHRSHRTRKSNTRGKMANGKSYGAKDVLEAPFDLVSA